MLLLPRRRSERSQRSGGALPAASLRLRLRTRLHRWQLDQALAGGFAPSSSPDLALRASRLTDPSHRRQLARSLRRIVADADNVRGPWLGSAVPARREVVTSWREALLGCAEVLERPVQIGPCGIARVVLLLTDVTGPLYNPHPAHTMRDVVWAIADGLQLCPPHDWECPVIMKRAPDHVAWTCARCGALATTDDLALKPS